eukprot:scaffold22.g6046.t1
MRPVGQARLALQTGLVLVIVMVWGAAAAAKSGTPLVDAYAQSVKALSPNARVAALELLAEWGALRRAAEAARARGGVAGAAAVQALVDHAEARLQQVPALATLVAEQHYAAGLPGGDAAGGVGLAHMVQRGLAAGLAADLAPRSRVASRLARALTLVNVAWFVGCVMVTVAGVALFGAHLAALVILVPLPAWEAAGYMASLWLLHRATLCRKSAAPYVALTGLFLFTACAAGTLWLHVPRQLRENERTATALLWFFAAVYGAVAVRLQAMLLGTLAVWWAVSALGFSIMVFPFLTIIGFRNGVAYPFAAALIMTLAFLPFKARPPHLHCCP